MDVYDYYAYVYFNRHRYWLMFVMNYFVPKVPEWAVDKRPQFSEKEQSLWFSFF